MSEQTTHKPQDAARNELHARYDALAQRVAGLTWDLGGLCYEMAIRDHFRLDVLARRAAVLQEADAELGEVERLLADAEQGIGGQCRACGAPHSRGAAFCWRCGQTLIGAGPVGSAVVTAPAAAQQAAPPIPVPAVSPDAPTETINVPVKTGHQER